MSWSDRPAEEPGTTGCPQDSALLARLRAGEDAAFGELFSRHCDAVRRMALGLVSDRAEAEDLVAEAFFRVLQAIRRGSGPVDNVRGYLLIVARRVAWEWNGRRRDVPVSDEELDVRVGADPDNTGQSTERNLITRAFTSLPERWRSVLWKVEVEGERPAVVAGKFGLSPNATAALARRARQGLRAAYLQAHLTTETRPIGCRPVLEKLGAYTAGAIKGAERHRVSTHLSVCPSCTSMYDELRDVCSGLRAHAAHLVVPVAGIGLWQQVKGFLAGAKTQVALAGAAAVGALGLALLPWGESDSGPLAFDDLDADEGIVLTDDSSAPTAPAIVPTTGQRLPQQRTDTIAVDVPAADVTTTDSPATRREGVARSSSSSDVPPLAAGGTTSGTPALGARSETEPYDESLPVVYEYTSTHRTWRIYDDREVYTLTTKHTRVNTADQTTVATTTTAYTSMRPTSDAQLMSTSAPAPR
ncbi:sigma-70 family RNA polymerase sigma factor [Actinokineospora fastidiosa]|uniref:RNA polymerase sigma factor n=1 Tax=Actinokineospora fastidiosa TaxID=1816 RepID=A0A918G5L8_9PSEU|nr:sigma-70 family RNA polymerase sigma factor [Actinokineospora fastidiosa]GGS18497.1 RNA polymerase sigma factor [Actinokineospora fastidiosa]